jgi:hypothetical protein
VSGAHCSSRRKPALRRRVGFCGFLRSSFGIIQYSFLLPIFSIPWIYVFGILQKI